MCALQEISGRSIQILCELHGASIACEDALLPGTQVQIRCKNGYKFPYQPPPATLLTCLDSGVWDYKPFSCVPTCGVKTPIALPFISSGRDISILQVSFN